MQMKRWAIIIATTVIIAIMFHVFTVIAIPYGINSVARKQLRDKYNIKFNTLYHPPPSNSESKDVPFPNPDSLYSICLYDVSNRPLHISANVPASYWSLSLYEQNMDNYFVLNDKQIKSGKAEIILTGKNNTISDKGNTTVVTSPTNKGMLLIRFLLENSDNLDQLIKIQKQATCNEME
jgi:uncharacterized membrane protein